MGRGGGCECDVPPRPDGGRWGTVRDVLGMTISPPPSTRVDLAFRMLERWAALGGPPGVCGEGKFGGGDGLGPAVSVFCRDPKSPKAVWEAGVCLNRNHQKNGRGGKKRAFKKWEGGGRGERGVLLGDLGRGLFEHSKGQERREGGSLQPLSPQTRIRRGRVYPLLFHFRGHSLC